VVAKASLTGREVVVKAGLAGREVVAKVGTEGRRDVVARAKPMPIVLGGSTG
jgi:hypothetical protein